MSEIDTSAEAVERRAVYCGGLAAWLREGGADEKAEEYDRLAATLRALVAERDSVNTILTNERRRIEALQQFMASQGVRIDRIEAARDAARAEVARLRSLLARADEELRLIRMKDTSALYDIGLRAAISTALAQEPRHD